MRLAFWRAGKDKPVVDRVAKPAPAVAKPVAAKPATAMPAVATQPSPAISICMRSVMR